MIELIDVHQQYPTGMEALNGISLKIEDGEFAFVVGPSGAGKSTLIKLLMAEERPTEGTVMVNGYNLSTIKKRKIPYLRRSMGVVFQDFRLISNLSVRDNVAFPLRVAGASNRVLKKRIPYILNLVGLDGKASVLPSELSGGEQQRVALARAIVNNSKLIIADEPTGNIDPKLSAEIMVLLDAINRLGTTVLVVTHDRGIVDTLKKRVIYIEAGKIVSDKAEGTYEREWLGLSD